MSRRNEELSRQSQEPIRRSEEARGQVLVLVAFSMVILIGAAALVTDIGLVLASQQSQRSMGDAAALAGAQELQLATTRTLTVAEQQEARGLAMANLVNRTGATASPTCATGGAPTADSDGDGKFGYAADVRNCALPGTNYTTSILTPSPLCVDCEADRAVMVELTRVNVPTFFSRIFGYDSWTVRQTSVAGLGFVNKYALITLRPPNYQTPDNDANAADVGVNGSGTSLSVFNGDVGTNTNHVLSGDGAAVNLDSGYRVRYYDTYQAWTSPPPGKQIFSLIQDPNYPYPAPVTTTYGNLNQAKLSVPQCAAEQLKVPVQYTLGGQLVSNLPIAKLTCLKPGIYNFRPSAQEGEVILLTPGVYYLNRGLFVHGAVIGGYEAGQPGVALVFRECVSASCNLDANNAEIFALNAGTRYQNLAGVEATAAIAGDGTPATTGGELNLTLTILVEKDPQCVPVEPYPFGCNDTQNQTLHMAGGGALYLAGVTYAPTDNIAVSGGSSGTGYIGQFISWTATYSGGTRVEQHYPGTEFNGILRLDAACSGGSSTSMSNASCNP